MKIIKALNKSKAIEILQYLMNEDKSYFSEIVVITHSNSSTTYRALECLNEAGLVSRCEDGVKRNDKVYYNITNKGIKVMNLVKKIDDID
ncbi:DNA-binding HxlR family transcriptional regulator [Methanococcus voltae]|uniref:winged helix-turn-helix domain-containing protein n=1 Tax=Methanococcus voltae TaxID=2188 RepID=UPI001AEA3FBB|nr:winged helix-turn-helix domain-containing protein [Methanococcus voltae]MBP2142877.1 DNA-binding HxlR family transcriptional regulator [Methanococcus voltae]